MHSTEPSSYPAQDQDPTYSVIKPNMRHRANPDKRDRVRECRGPRRRQQPRLERRNSRHIQSVQRSQQLPFKINWEGLTVVYFGSDPINSRPPTVPPVKMECAASSESLKLAAILLDTDTARDTLSCKKSPDEADARVTRAKKSRPAFVGMCVIGMPGR
ncbi:hypothetical protein JAAARDRAFT_30865 [Jaapia argillacea MUCL 33604]|uniref:Uncharacterized protein n=1 Tax=Jaapia argillacea MUCL 33604 TaxID=933084 RepID=A0A067Q399_9AGAM|nr:hypothetical protein JAAARDRAFT_30865 [Jaapia argillacea MUCL 33604]